MASPYFFTKKNWRPFWVIASGKWWPFLAVVSSSSSHVVYPVFFLNSATKINFSRVSPPGGGYPGRSAPPPSDATGNDDTDSGLYSMFTCSLRLPAVCGRRRSPSQDPSWCSWWFAALAWSNPSPPWVRSFQSWVTYSQPPVHALQPPCSVSAPRSRAQAARSTSYCTHYKTKENTIWTLSSYDDDYY